MKLLQEAEAVHRADLVAVHQVDLVAVHRVDLVQVHLIEPPPRAGPQVAAVRQSVAALDLGFFSANSITFFANFI